LKSEATGATSNHFKEVLEIAEIAMRALEGSVCGLSLQVIASSDGHISSIFMREFCAILLSGAV